VDRNTSLALLLASLPEVPPNAPAVPGRFADAPTFAQFLRNHRQGRNVTLEQMGKSTKIALPHLEALERGDVDHLPPGIYRRAIVRAHAAAIGLDPEDILREYLALFPLNNAPGVPTPAPTPPRVNVPEAVKRGVDHLREWVRRLGARQPVAAVSPAWPVPSARAFRSVGGPAALVLLGYASAGVFPLESFGRLTGGIRATVGVPAAVPAPGPAVVAGSSTVPVHTATRRVPDGARELDAATAAAISPSASGTEAHLVVTSNPSGARVTVDGVGWGSTPVTIRHLPPGTKQIRLSKDGFLTAARTVELTGDRTTHSVRLVLQPGALTGADEVRSARHVPTSLPGQ
jgi:hypothetical protein